MLDDLLSKDEIIKLQNFIATLTPNTSKLITVSKVKVAVMITEQLAAMVLKRCVEIGIMKMSFGIKCPECGTVLKKIDILCFDEIVPCYKCEDFSFSVTKDDIVVFFELIVKIPPFNQGQQKNDFNHEVKEVLVAPCDSLKSFEIFCGTAADYLNKKMEHDNEGAKKNKLLKKNAYRVMSIEKDILEASELRRNTNKNISLIIQVLLFSVYLWAIYLIYINVEDSKLSCTLSVSSSIFVFVADKLLNNFLCTDISILKSKEAKKYRKVLDDLNEEKKDIELGIERV